MLPIPPRENLTIKCSDSVFYKDHRYIVHLFKIILIIIIKKFIFTDK